MTIRAAFGLPEYHLPQPTAPRLAAALGMAAWQLSGHPSHLVGRMGGECKKTPTLPPWWSVDVSHCRIKS